MLVSVGYTVHEKLGVSIQIRFILIQFMIQKKIIPRRGSRNTPCSGS